MLQSLSIPHTRSSVSFYFIFLQNSFTLRIYIVYTDNYNFDIVRYHSTNSCDLRKCVRVPVINFTISLTVCAIWPLLTALLYLSISQAFNLQASSVRTNSVYAGIDIMYMSKISECNKSDGLCRIYQLHSERDFLYKIISLFISVSNFENWARVTTGCLEHFHEERKNDCAKMNANRNPLSFVSFLSKCATQKRYEIAIWHTKSMAAPKQYGIISMRAIILGIYSLAVKCSKIYCVT